MSKYEKTVTRGNGNPFNIGKPDRTRTEVRIDGKLKESKVVFDDKSKKKPNK